MHSIAISLNVNIHGLKSKFHHSSHAATERHRPHASVRCGRIPIGGDDRLGGEVPALLHVVINEVLQKHLIDVRTAARYGLVAVGNWKIGPTPQINLWGLLGESKNVGCMSPSPETPV